LQSLFLNTNPKHFKFPTPSKISSNVSARSRFFNVWYRRWASRIHSKGWYVAVNTQLYHNNYNGSYMFPLKISQHQVVYVRENYIHVVYIYLKMIIGRYPDLTYGSFHVKWTNEKTRPSLILCILGRLEVPREVWKSTNFHNFICCSFSLIALWNMKKWVTFRKHAVAKTIIHQVVTDIEGCDKHVIEAFIKSFNLIRLKTNFHKFFISRSFKIFLKFEFFKNVLF
jgi:hypothetical protein